MTFFARHRLIFLVLAVLTLELSVYLFIVRHEDSITPIGHVHTMHPLDLYYPGIIRQSKLGAWAITDPYTTLPTPAIHAYIFFILLGKLAAFFSLDPIALYEVSKILGGVALVIGIYWCITTLLPKSLRGISLLFALLVDTGPVWTDGIAKSITQWSPAMPGATVIARTFSFPHHTVAEAMGLLLLSLIYRCAKSAPSFFLLPVIFFLAFIGTSFAPPYFVILTLCLFLPWLLYALATKTLKKTFPPILSASLGIVLAGLWIKYEFAKGPPWSDYVFVEKSWWPMRDIFLQFVQSWSLYYPFVILLFILLPFSFNRWSKQLRQILFLSFSWAFLPFGLILLSAFPWFPIANGRIASDVSVIPMSILSALGVYALYQAIKPLRHAKTYIAVLLLLWTGFSLLFSTSYVNQTLKEHVRVRDKDDYGWIMYPTDELWDGIMALRDIPNNSNIMVLPHVGQLIPTYFPLRVYAGPPYSYLNWWIRRDLSHKFYTGKMSKDEVDRFLSENTISSVFYGPEEIMATKTPLLYPDRLSIQYQNSEVTIFKVISRK